MAAIRAGSVALALGAMPITAAVIGDLRVLAVLAAHDMAAESYRAAALDRRHYLQLAETDMASIGFTPSWSMVAEDPHEREVPCHLGAVERHGEEETQRCNRAIDARRTHAGPRLMQLEKAKILRRGRIRRAAEKGCECPDVPDIVVVRLSTKLRTVMSSIMRRRSGLMGFSLIGSSCLEV